MKILQLENISKRFEKAEDKVLDHLDLKINKGDFHVIVGESGCGKTTLLRVIAGLDEPDEGKVSVAAEVMNDGNKFVLPEERNIGFVFQDYALFPHLTVSKNIEFGITSKEHKVDVIEKYLRLTGMTEKKDSYPHELSGGQQQRVALARALATQPQLILLDEPFSNLDSDLKREMRLELFQLLKDQEVTAIMVTHDMEDALHLADAISVMHKGRLVQTGTPTDIYDLPENLLVAKQMGFMNVVEANLSNNMLFTPFGEFKYEGGLTSENVIMGVRPEYIKISEKGAIEAKVIAAKFDRGRLLLQLSCTKGVELFAYDYSKMLKAGDQCRLSIRNYHVFNE